jgi:hypothetical protein
MAAARTVAATVPSNQGPGIPDPEVWLSPVDSTTGTGPEVVPRVVVMHSGIPLGSALVALERNISLRAWPSLTPVEITFRAADAQGTNPGEPSTIDVVPTQPLPDGWYVLAVTDLPAPFGWPRFQPVVSDPRIGYGVRFRTSSSPFAGSVLVCAKADGKTEVRVDYSELLDAAAGVEASVAQGVACVPDAPDSRGRYFGSITYVCNHAIDQDKPIDVRAGALLGAAGVRASPLSVAVVPALMDPAGPGCRILRMPLPL